MIPRGIRNNNPGNIESGEDWKGLRRVRTDPRFAEFQTMEYGIRALAKIMLSYDLVHGIDTVRRIVARFAPSADGNDVSGYVAHVARQMRIHPDQALDMEDRATLEELVAAIVRHENGMRADGTDWLDGGQIAAGVDMALKG